MGVGERIRQIRKHLNLSQTQFGDRIGYKQTGIGLWENSQRAVPESSILLICSEFNINESWLRFGQGEMFNKSDTISLDDYAKAHNLTDVEQDIIRLYMSLDESTRELLMSRLKAVFLKHPAATKNVMEPASDEKDDTISPDAVAKAQEESSAADAYDIDKKVESYRRELENEEDTLMSQASQNTKEHTAS